MLRRIKRDEDRARTGPEIGDGWSEIGSEGDEDATDDGADDDDAADDASVIETSARCIKREKVPNNEDVEGGRTGGEDDEEGADEDGDA